MKIIIKIIQQAVFGVLAMFFVLTPVGFCEVELTQFDTVMPPVGVQISLTLDAEATRQTTTTVALTKYPIVGNFTYSPLVGFTEASDILTYTGTLTRDLRFDFHSSMKSNAGTTTAHIAIFYNGILYNPKSIMGTFEKTAGEAKAMSVGCVFEDVETGDTFQLVLWSDQAGAIITVTHITAIISSFGR